MIQYLLLAQSDPDYNQSLIELGLKMVCPFFKETRQVGNYSTINFKSGTGFLATAR